MPCVDSSEKAGKAFERLQLESKIISCDFIIFSFAKRGVLCASKLAKLIIRIDLFCTISNGLVFEQYVLHHTTQPYVRKGYIIA